MKRITATTQGPLPLPAPRRRLFAAGVIRPRRAPAVGAAVRPILTLLTSERAQ
jgi:hypothetical protein